MYCITNYVNYDINERCQWIHTAHHNVTSNLFMTSRIAPSELLNHVYIHVHVFIAGVGTDQRINCSRGAWL